MTRRLASVALPLRIREHDEAFLIRDAAEKSVAAVYFDDGDFHRRMARQRFTREEALEIVKSMARGLTADVERAKANPVTSGDSGDNSSA